MPVINVNSVDPDQMPHSVVSDLGLYCLPMSHLWTARHKWVNIAVFGYLYYSIILLLLFFQPEPSEHSHLVNFAGLANFSLDKNGIYEEFQVRITTSYLP